MDQQTPEIEHEKRGFPATVVTVVDKLRVAINRGAIDGVREGQRYLVYGDSGEEITDPETGEPLGRLEVYRGTGRVLLVQEKMATLESDMIEPAEKALIREPRLPGPKSILSAAFSVPDRVVEVKPAQKIPFRSVARGDRAKPI